MKATFLFGAGADSVYGICQGGDFREALLTEGLADTRKKLLGSDMGNYSLIYKGSIHIFIQTIANNADAAARAFGVNNDIVNAVVEYYKTKRKACPVEIRDACDEWYKLLTDGRDDGQKSIRDFFLNHMVFFDALDGKMNDLRNENLNANGKRIVNTYATIFILMLQQIYEIDSDFEWTFKNIFDVLTDEKWPRKLKTVSKSYYTVLKDYINSAPSNAAIHIATTNYTPIIEEVISERKDSIEYLHGRLNWFEDRIKLTVYDCKDKKERKLAEQNVEHLIPFILIPSGVKPIICSRQLQQFSKYISNLDDSDYLFVVGYRFNSEDNHINALVGEWLRKKGKHLIYFNYSEEGSDGLNLRSLPWLAGFEEPYTVKLEEGDVEQNKQEINNHKIINVEINKKNGVKVFEKMIQKVQQIS